MASVQFLKKNCTLEPGGLSATEVQVLFNRVLWYLFRAREKWPPQPGFGQMVTDQNQAAAVTFVTATKIFGAFWRQKF